MLKTFKKHLNLILLVSILFFALFVRTIKLAETPSGFHADEASFYINALSISQTGMDEDGNSFPLSINSLIDPKPALYSYFQIPFINLFENQIFAARFTSVVLSIFSLFVVYLFIKEFSDKRIALISTFILSISPWHILVSRGTHEVIASFLFLVSSLLFLTYFLKKKLLNKNLSLILFFVSSLLSMYFYHSAKVILPLLVLSIIFYFYKKSKIYIKKGALILFITVIAVLSSLSIQESSSRISAVSIFSDKGPQQKLLEQTYTSRENIPITVLRVFYNKVQTYSLATTGEYLKYFSPEFLFLSGEKPTRYIIPDHGLLYLIEIPLLLLGIFVAIKSKRKELLIIFAILFISPIPAALTTQETPSLLRSFPMVIAFAYFIAVGLNYIFSLKNKLFKYLLLFLLVITFTWQVLYFAIQYHIQARYTQPWFRNSPYSKISKEVSLIINNYDEVHVTNDLRPLYSYFVIDNLISINDLQSNPQARDNKEYTLGKFHFNKDVCDFDELQTNILYIAETGCRDKNQELKDLEVVTTIYYDDDVEVYELLQKNK